MSRQYEPNGKNIYHLPFLCYGDNGKNRDLDVELHVRLLEKLMLKIFFKRKFSALITACSLIVAGAGIFGLARTGNTFPVGVQVLGWLVVAVMLWGVVVGFRQLWRPPLMYSVDRRGVMIHYDAERILFGTAGVYLPWEIITGMTLEKRMTSGGSGSNPMYTWVIACTLKGEAPFPVRQHSAAYDPKDKERVVCLDAFTGTISQQAMLDRLHSLWQASLS